MRHRPIPPTRWLPGALLALALATPPLAAQATRARANPIQLSDVITAFLVDSGVRTRGLPWTTGDALPIRWDTPKPVPLQDEWLKRKGLTHVRNGTFTGTAGDSVALPMTISVTGIATGLARMSVGIASTEVTRSDGSGYFATREMIEQALKNEGLTLSPLKCNRETEGASYGNLVDAVKAPAKTASGLWWAWDSPQQAFQLTLTLLYRRADMTEVECAG